MYMMLHNIISSYNRVTIQNAKWPMIQYLLDCTRLPSGSGQQAFNIRFHTTKAYEPWTNLGLPKRLN